MLVITVKVHNCTILDMQTKPIRIANLANARAHHILGAWLRHVWQLFPAVIQGVPWLSLESVQSTRGL